MNPAVAQALAACLVLGVLAASAAVRPVRDVGPPAPLPAATAEPWMADCLPGVGIKTRDRAADLLRAGRIAALPPRAQAMARDWFVAGTGYRPRPTDQGR